ncbi:MAG: ribokinase [Oscillospiraceae bacterium]|nr:ribokinase [Oscillospiraceae bacterium]
MVITNFGSLNIDNVYSVENFVSPGETITCLDLNRYCGGKGLNQSIALSRSGASVRHAGCIGANGAILKDMLKQNNVDVSMLLEIDGDSGHTVIQVDKTGQNNIIVYSGANRRLTKQYIDDVLDVALHGEILLLQNEINLGDYIVKTAKQKGMVIAFNPSPVDDFLLNDFPLDMVDIFIINEIEAAALTGITASERAASELLKRFPASKIALTLGENGAVYYDAADRYQQKSYVVPVVDTTAAGDTFTGYFLTGFSAGKPIPECLRTGCLAASLTVSSKGAATSIPMMSDVTAMSLQV